MRSTCVPPGPWTRYADPASRTRRAGRRGHAAWRPRRVRFAVEPARMAGVRRASNAKTASVCLRAVMAASMRMAMATGAASAVRASTAMIAMWRYIRGWRIVAMGSMATAMAALMRMPIPTTRRCPAQAWGCAWASSRAVLVAVGPVFIRRSTRRPRVAVTGWTTTAMGGPTMCLVGVRPVPLGKGPVPRGAYRSVMRTRAPCAAMLSRACRWPSSATGRTMTATG